MQSSVKHYYVECSIPILLLLGAIFQQIIKGQLISKCLLDIKKKTRFFFKDFYPILSAEIIKKICWFFGRFGGTKKDIL